jgi:hypothetical protein
MAEINSDDEHEQIEPTAPQWRLFEEEVARVHKELDAKASIRHNVHLIGRKSGTPRQVDVLIEGEIAGQTLRIVAECKRYARKLGIGGVDEFAGKLQDLNVERGLLFTVKGFTAPALKRAEGADVPLIQLRQLDELPSHPIDLGSLLALKFGDCPNENCYTGDVSWRELTSAEEEKLEAGRCDTCGTDAVRCTECGEVIVLDEERCCDEAKYSSDTWHDDDWSEITRTVDGKETLFN